jgi:hypothetical protein
MADADLSKVTAKGADGHTYTISKDGHVSVEVDPYVNYLVDPQERLKDAKVETVNGQPVITLPGLTLPNGKEIPSSTIALSDIKDESGKPVTSMKFEDGKTLQVAAPTASARTPDMGPAIAASASAPAASPQQGPNVIWGGEQQAPVGAPPRGPYQGNGVTGADVAGKYIIIDNQLYQQGTPAAAAALAKITPAAAPATNAPAAPAAAAPASGNAAQDGLAGVVSEIGKTDFKAMSPEQLRTHAVDLHKKLFDGVTGEQLQQVETTLLSGVDKLKADGKLDDAQAKAMKAVFEHSEDPEAFADAIVENSAALDSISPAPAPARPNGASRTGAASAAPAAAAGALGASNNPLDNGKFDLQSMMQNMSQMGGFGAIFGIIAMVVAAMKNPDALRNMDFGGMMAGFGGGGQGGSANPDQAFASIKALPELSLTEAMKLPKATVVAEVKDMLETIYKNGGNDGKPVQYHFGGNQAFLVTRDANGALEIRDIDGENVSGAVTSFVMGGSPAQVARLAPEDMRIATRELTLTQGPAPQTTEGRLLESAGSGAVIVRANFPDPADIKYGGGHIEAQKLHGQQIAINREQGGTYTLTAEQKNGNTVAVTTYKGIEKTDLPPDMQKAVNDAFVAANAAPATQPQQDQQLGQQGGQARLPAAGASS